MKKIFFLLLCSAILTSCFGGTSQDKVEDIVGIDQGNQNVALEDKGIKESEDIELSPDEVSDSDLLGDEEEKPESSKETLEVEEIDIEIEENDIGTGVLQEKQGENGVTEQNNDEPDLMYWLQQYYPDTDIRKSRILYEEDKYIYGDYLYWSEYLEDYGIKYFFGVRKKNRYLILKDIDQHNTYCSSFETLPVNFIPDCLDDNSNIVFTKNPSIFYKGMSIEDREIVHDMMGISDSGEEYEGKSFCFIKDIGYNYLDSGCSAVGSIGGYRSVYGKKDGKWGVAFEGHDISEVSGLEFKVVVNDDGSYEKVFSFTKFQD